MKSTAHTSVSLKYTLLLSVLAVAGVALVLYATGQYGAGLTPDSVGYVGTARNLLAGEGFLSYDGTPVVHWPPLYPALLGLVGGILGTDPLLIANAVHALIFGLIVFAGGVLLLRLLPSFPALAFLGTLSILFSIPLFAISVVAYSEPLFILFILLSFLFADAYASGKHLTPLLLLSVSVSLSCLTRYIGITLIAWGLIMILLYRTDGTPLKKRLLHAAVFTCISIIPVGIWIVRNHFITGTLVGPRASSIYSLSQNLSFVFSTLLYWSIPGKIVRHRSILMLMSAVIGFYLGLLFHKGWQGAKQILRSIFPAALFVLLYLVFLVITSTTTAYDTIGLRLLSPIAVPLTLCCFMLANALVQPLRERLSKRITNIILLSGIMILLIYPVRSVVLDAKYLNPNGQGYSSRISRNSETIRYILQHRTENAGSTYYTNDPYAAYFGAHLAAKMTPSKTEYNSPVQIADINRLKGSWPEGNRVRLFWFDMPGRSYLFSIRELQTIADIIPIAHLKDGTIYSVTRK